MAEKPPITEIEADDRYFSETLQQFVFSYHCPTCQTWNFVSQSGDVARCDCGTFLRVVFK